MIEYPEDKKIAIFDHVGIQAGMNYYDDGLMGALSSKGISSYVFSNYYGIYRKDVTYYNYFQKTTNCKKLSRLFRFISSTVKSSTTAKSQKNIDLVLIHIFSFEFITLLLALIPKLFSLRIGLIVHDISSFKNNDNSWFRNVMLNYISKYIVVHNRYSYDELIKIQKIRDTEKIHVIKHGSYCKYLRDTKLIKNSNFNFISDKTKKHILFFGQIKNDKGLDMLISSMDKIDKNIHLIIAGRGETNAINDFNMQINNLKNSNRTTVANRFIEHDEMIALFNNVDMIVLPYKRIYFSGVLMLAMSIGLPILTSDLIPFKEIIKHKKNGLLFRWNDDEDLIININKYINNTKFLYEIAENARQFVEKEYSWSNIAEEYVRLVNLHQKKELRL